jgi:hypothetical protein
VKNEGRQNEREESKAEEEKGIVSDKAWNGLRSDLDIPHSQREGAQRQDASHILVPSPKKNHDGGDKARATGDEQEYDYGRSFHNPLRSPLQILINPSTDASINQGESGQ